MRQRRLASVLGGAHKSQGLRVRRRTLALEPLEDRYLLSVTAGPFVHQAQPLDLVVTTAVDKLDTSYDLANLSLRDALALANANPDADTISFAPSLSGGTINLSLGELAITDSVTIEGLGATNLTINGNSQSRIFNVDDGNSDTNINVEIDGLTLTGGSADNGGAIYSAEDLVLDSVKISGNTATDGGGGVYALTSSDTTIRNSTISTNSASYGGGLFSLGTGQTVIQASTISANTATAVGGGLCVGTSGGVVVEDSTVSGNSVDGSSPLLWDGQGGGIFVANTGTATIQNCTVSGNSALSGGGMFVENFGTATIQNSTISGNSAVTAGGGIYASSAGIDGISGIYGITLPSVSGGTTTIDGTTISGNGAAAGGGIYWRASSSSQITLQNSTFFGNSASADGGGIWAETPDGSTTLIQNSTITGNTAQGTGGGLFVSLPTTASSTTPTTTYAPPVVDVRSTILAGNTDASGTAPDVFDPAYVSDTTTLASHIVNFTNCLVGDNTGTDLVATLTGEQDLNGNLVGSSTAPMDPLLAPLADNGGPTQTCAPLPGSPAIDRGSNAAGLTYDQRGVGYARVLGAQADIGAYEAAPPLAAPTVGLYDPSSSTFLLRNTNDSGFADEVCPYGAAGAHMVPIAGDWDGNGVQSIGLYDPSTSTFYLRNTNGLQGPDDHGYADVVFVFGPANSGDEPVVGDWNGDGRDTVGLYDPSTSTFYLRNTNGLQGPDDHGYADVVFNYGAPKSGMLPVAGDWDGSGRDGIGLYSQATSTFYLRESTQFQGPSDHGYADIVFNYGAPHSRMLPVAGDWDGSGQDGIGLYSQATSMFYLRESTHLQGPSDQGFADRSFMYGSANGNQLPLVGSWTSGVGPVTTDVPATSGTAVHSTETFPAVITSIRLTAPATQSPTADDSAADSTTATDLQQVQSASGDVTSGTAQSQTIDAQTLDRLDLSTVLRNMPGLHDLDAVADDLLGGAGANAAHTDAVLAS
jgi:parallel beta-helix repeat protein